MNKHFPILMLMLLSALGCSKIGSPQEPPGKAVELTQQDMDQVSYTYEEMRMWSAWQTKGNKLISTVDGNVPSKDDLESALYCFHQAEKRWPEKPPEAALNSQKRIHLDTPTDTMLSKGRVYLLLHEPQLAKYYYEKWNGYFPGNAVAGPEIAKADAMIKQQ